MNIEQVERIREELGLEPGVTAWELVEAFAILHAAPIIAERDRLLDLARRLAEALEGVLGLIDGDEDDKTLLKEAEEMLREK